MVARRITGVVKAASAFRLEPEGRSAKWRNGHRWNDPVVLLDVCSIGPCWTAAGNWFGHRSPQSCVSEELAMAPRRGVLAVGANGHLLSLLGAGARMSTSAQVDDVADRATGTAFSADWWKSRSADELRDMINRGFAGGDLFSGATAEAARRSGEARLLADEEAAALSRRQRRKKRNMLVLQVLVGLSLIATLFTTAVVVMHLGE